MGAALVTLQHFDSRRVEGNEVARPFARASGGAVEVADSWDASLVEDV